MSDIIAISRLISTTTDTNRYVPKMILNRPSVQSGRDCGIGLISSDVVRPNTAKNSRSNATIGVIFSICLFLFAIWFFFIAKKIHEKRFGFSVKIFQVINCLHIE